tara:strand:+ start:987 stop:1319 length:333 start_codon:yes stop_codon:yes gene_type:complete
MWIVSNVDKAIATIWGSTVSLKAGEPKEVGREMGLLCLQEGCLEAEPQTKTVEKVVEVVELVEEIAVEETPLDLEAMTKTQLEQHGRTIGIELDRRKKKADLIEEIQAAQ